MNSQQDKVILASLFAFVLIANLAAIGHKTAPAFFFILVAVTGGHLASPFLRKKLTRVSVYAFFFWSWFAFFSTLFVTAMVLSARA